MKPVNQSNINLTPDFFPDDRQRKLNADKVEKTYSKLARVIVQLLMEEPFYAHILQGMTREVTCEIETAAVSVRNSRIILMVNPDFFMSLESDRQRKGLLKHEVLHVVLNHLTRPENNEKNPRLLVNLAADIVVNQLIPDNELPPNPVTLNSFEGLKLEKNKNLSYYIDKLRVYAKKFKVEIIFQGCHSNHDLWEDEEAAVDNSVLGIYIGKLIKEARTRGNIPSNVLEQIRRETEEPAAIGWKEVLKKFVNRSGQTFLKSTLRRKSKRYGTRPGIKIDNQLRLLVAIDTSGSVSNLMLTEFFREINAIGKQVSELWVADCDTKVHRCRRYERGVPITVMGRGGTLLDPVFEFINNSPGRFDAAVYLTDGFAPQPKIKPVKPVLLVINGNNHPLKPAPNVSIIEFKSESK